ncbi:thiamine phosphate synthase [Aneurinibacillus tyrosinisolvens]|uniref:thiamine phosphate synthase n=1 Tax=Aneurinibacillus tyrosinisolvens TaxID=1443435 RepID=UPI00069BC69C|nr:thiamine phosphate synthase [Aneurinibacillus tyrosinisolvens]
MFIQYIPAGSHIKGIRPFLVDKKGKGKEVSRHVIHVISNGKQPLEKVAGTVRKIHPYIDVFHLREKERTARELADSVYCLYESGLPPARLSINDRLDVALAVQAGYIHLAYHSLPPMLAKRLVHTQKIGVSVHNVEEAVEAERGGADYLLFGHVFPTNSKPGLPPRGLPALRHVVKASGIPVIALGGITPANAAEALATGCAGIALMSAVMEAGNPELAAKQFRSAIDEAYVKPLHPWFTEENGGR